jgi:hypothetical protein
VFVGCVCVCVCVLGGPSARPTGRTIGGPQHSEHIDHAHALVGRTSGVSGPGGGGGRNGEAERCRAHVRMAACESMRASTLFVPFLPSFRWRWVGARWCLGGQGGPGA